MRLKQMFQTEFVLYRGEYLESCLNGHLIFQDDPCFFFFNGTICFHLGSHVTRFVTNLSTYNMVVFQGYSRSFIIIVEIM